MSNKQDTSYPPVTVRVAIGADGAAALLFEGGSWIVEQGGSILAICPSFLAASIIAERLNEWFNRKQ